MLTVTALLLLHLPFASAAAVNPQSRLDATLHSTVDVYSLNASSYVEALTTVASDFKIPMGIVWIRSNTTERKLDLLWKRTSVVHVLETVVRSAPGYKLEVKNGVANIAPDDLNPEQNFLNIRVDRFSVQNVVAETASHRLRDVARLRVSPNLISPGRLLGGMGYSQASRTDEPKITVSLENASVRTILDTLLLDSTRKIWIVTFPSDTALTKGGFRRTSKLGNTNSIADDEQPVWELFRWGERLPSPHEGGAGPSSKSPGQVLKMDVKLQREPPSKSLAAPPHQVSK